METITRVLAFCACLLLPLKISSADLSVKTAKAEPQGISGGIREVLQPEAVQLVEGGKPVLEIWLRKEVPLKSGSASLNSIPETALMGAVAVHGDQFTDYKDNPIKPGIYTARFVLQPQDGDHLGTAVYSTFIALLPAEADTEVAGYDKYRPMVRASGKLTPSGHPVVLSLRPASGESGDGPKLTEPDAEHKAIRLKVAAKPKEGEAKELAFDLVYKGHGHIQ